MSSTHWRIDELRQKYLTVLELARELGVRIDKVEMYGPQLRIIGEAPSMEMKNRIWDQITTVDPTYSDLICRITVNPARAHGVVSPALIDPEAAAPHRGLTYTVQFGDTLESISHLFYGTAGAAKKIVDANAGHVDDPAHLEPGMILQIPS